MMMPSSMLIFQRMFLAYLISETWVCYFFCEVGRYINTQRPLCWSGGCNSSHLLPKQCLRSPFHWMCLVQRHSPMVYAQTVGKWLVVVAVRGM